MMIVANGGKLARIVVAGGLLAAAALAAPPLTTIQDVLYRADGKLFNGVAVIGWKSFEAADASNITMQDLTVRIVNGVLKVQLVPNANSTPAGYYSVKYSSDGKIQFEETWQVPASTQLLRVRDVRVTVPNYVAPVTGTVEESDIPGLLDDLAARPVKGPGFVPGRAAMIGVAGTIDSISGNLADCIRVDGSSGPCGGLDMTFIDGETPTGSMDGSNTTFQLSLAPDPVTSLMIVRNGIVLTANQDYTLNGTTLQFGAGAVPQSGDLLSAWYRVPGGAGTGGPSAVTPQVLCSTSGQSTTSSMATSLGTCTIAANVLRPGDRVEVQFNYQHQGTGSGFSFQVRWGGTTVVQRNAAAAETLATGRAEAAISSSGAAISVQSWGAVLVLASAVTATTDTAGAPITVTFYGNLSISTTDELKLQHFSVVRYPGR